MLQRIAVLRFARTHPLCAAPSASTFTNSGLIPPLLAFEHVHVSKYEPAQAGVKELLGGELRLPLALAYLTAAHTDMCSRGPVQRVTSCLLKDWLSMAATHDSGTGVCVVVYAFAFSHGCVCVGDCLCVCVHSCVVGAWVVACTSSISCVRAYAFLHSRV